MYKVGTFTNPGDQSQPGVYSRLSSGPQTRISSLTYGGVALPWPTYKVVSEPDPVPVTPSTLSSVATRECLANTEFFKKICANIMANASEVYICPYTRNVVSKVETETKYHPSCGWSEDGIVQIAMSLAASGESQACTNHFQPLVVTVSSKSPNTYSFEVEYPWAKTQFKSTGEISVANIGDGKPIQKPITFKSEDEDEKFLYNFYGKDGIVLNFSIKRSFSGKKTVVIGGGYMLTDVAVNAIKNASSKAAPGLGPGALFALEGEVEGPTEFNEGRVLYLPNFSAPAAYKDSTSKDYSANFFAVAELRNWKATLTLYTYCEHTGRLTTRILEEKDIPRAENNERSNAPIYDILTTMENIAGVPYEGDKGSAWKESLLQGQVVRVGFASFHVPSSVSGGFQETEMTKFLSTVGKTGSSLVFYVPDKNLFTGDRSKSRDIHQQIQVCYLDNTGSLCPSTQLVMDETWYPGAHEWDETTTQMTHSTPFCVSTAGDSRGDVHSLLNSAFMVGIMAQCGERRTATAALYSGPDLQIFTQQVTERMHEVGVMTWHSHVGDKMIYIDSSSYRKNIPPFESVSYPAVFERNQPVRAVNKFRFESAKMFITNYFEKNWYGVNAVASIQSDILMLIRELADAGIFAPPESSSDVTVQNLSERAYSAEVKLQLRDNPEILYISLEV